MAPSWTVTSFFILSFTTFKICDSLYEPRCGELDPTNSLKWVSITPGRCVYGEYDVTLTIGSSIYVIKERVKAQNWTDAVNFCATDHPDAFLYITSSVDNELDVMAIQDLVEGFGQQITLLGSEYVWQACHYTGSLWECLDHTYSNPHYWESPTNYTGFWRWDGSSPSGAFALSGCLVLSLYTGLMEAHDCNDNSATSPLIMCAVDLHNDTPTTPRLTSAFQTTTSTPTFKTVSTSTTTTTETTTEVTTERSTKHLIETTTEETTNLVPRDKIKELSTAMSRTTLTPTTGMKYLSSPMKTTEIVSAEHSTEPSTDFLTKQLLSTTALTTTRTQSTTKAEESIKHLNAFVTFNMTTPIRTSTSTSATSNSRNINMYQKAVFRESNFTPVIGEPCPQFGQQKMPVTSPMKCAILCVSAQTYCVSFNYILKGNQKLCQLNYETGRPDRYHPPGECIFHSRE